jgi:uncharacterized membrane protein
MMFRMVCGEGCMLFRLLLGFEKDVFKSVLFEGVMVFCIGSLISNLVSDSETHQLKKNCMFDEKFYLLHKKKVRSGDRTSC